MVTEKIFYGCKCDGCGTMLRDECEEDIYYDQETYIKDVAWDSEWLVTADGHHYCPDCRQLNDEDIWECKDGKRYDYTGNPINE